jgi:heme A synthase
LWQHCWWPCLCHKVHQSWMTSSVSFHTLAHTAHRRGQTSVVATTVALFSSAAREGRERGCDKC